MERLTCAVLQTTMPNPTLELARRIAESSWAPVNDAIGDEAVRALVNWLSCALAGSRAAFADTVLEGRAATTEDAEATVLGIGDRLGLLACANLTACGAEALGYADTHAPTGLCPSAAIGGALLPLAEHHEASGAAFVHAYILGVELACRTAVAVGAPASPRTPEGVLCNALGAAAACAKLLGLDAQRTALALDLASAAVDADDENAVKVQGRSTAGFSATTGLLMALHARDADEASLRAAPRSPLGNLIALSNVFMGNWISHRQSSSLAYHAYPCALALHPVVEACLQLRPDHPLSGCRIVVRMHPSIVDMNRDAQPATAEAARNSIAHAAAAALLDGRVGLHQFEAAKLHHASVRELRARIEVIPDKTLPETAAHVTLIQPDGATLQRLVRCALGHPLRPLGDRDLSDKFRGLAGDMLATGQIERLLGLAWNMRALPDMGGLIRTTVAEDVYEPAELPGSPLIPR